MIQWIHKLVIKLSLLKIANISNVVSLSSSPNGKSLCRDTWNLDNPPLHGFILWRRSLSWRRSRRSQFTNLGNQNSLSNSSNQRMQMKLRELRVINKTWIQYTINSLSSLAVLPSKWRGKTWPSVTLASRYERFPAPGLAGDYVSHCPCPVSSDKVICDFAL